jgi:hypothetical protein
MNSNYVVDILTHFYRDYSVNDSSSSNWKQYVIKIDVNGNVVVSQSSLSSSKHNHDISNEFTKILEINDNIPIPSYLIPVIKQMFPCCSIVSRDGDCSYHPTKKYTNLYNNHWEIMIGLLKKLKQEIKKTHEDLNKNLHTKHEVEKYNIKFIDLQEDKNLELEKKIDNLNTKISEILNDNEKIKENNKLLEEKIIKLEFNNIITPTEKKNETNSL